MNDDSELYGRYYNPEEEKRYWDEVREEYARKEAYENGLSQGTLSNQQEIVRNMYNNNLNPKTISEYTNIPINTVRNIIKMR